MKETVKKAFHEHVGVEMGLGDYRLEGVLIELEGVNSEVTTDQSERTPRVTTWTHQHQHIQIRLWRDGP